MRVKSGAGEYRYLPEDNILPIKLSDEFSKDAIASCPELMEDKLHRYKQDYHLSEYDTSLLLANKDVSTYFDEVVKYTNNFKLAANWINVDVASYLNKNFIEINDFKLKAKDLADLINLIDKNEVNSNQARNIFSKMIEDDISAKEAKEKLGISSQISDVDFVKNLINEVFSENEDAIISYKEGKGRALGFLVGQVMKKSKGRVNPKLTTELVTEELERR